MEVAGRLRDAELSAERAVHLLERIYPPEHPMLLRPLEVLAAARFEQGKMATAREAIQRMQAIRVERPRDMALVQSTSAALLQAEGRRGEAESAHLAAIDSWRVAGDETAELGVAMVSLASVYIQEKRFKEAKQALDRALPILLAAPDAVPLDMVKVLYGRAVLQSRHAEWLEAERNLQNAVAIAERYPRLSPVLMRRLLIDYAYVLRKNHHRTEARSIERRAEALAGNGLNNTVVDVPDLLAKVKSRK